MKQNMSKNPKWKEVTDWPFKKCGRVEFGMTKTKKNPCLQLHPYLNATHHFGPHLPLPTVGPFSHKCALLLEAQSHVPDAILSFFPSLYFLHLLRFAAHLPDSISKNSSFFMVKIRATQHMFKLANSDVFYMYFTFCFMK